MILNYFVRSFTLKPSLRGGVVNLIAKYNLKLDYEKLRKDLDAGIEVAKKAGNLVIVTQLETFEFVLPRMKKVE